MSTIRWKSDVGPNILYYNLWYHIEPYIDKENKEKLSSVIKTLVDTSIKQLNCKDRAKNTVVKEEEFVEVISMEDKLVVVGYDDAGQCYFIVYNEDGELKYESCGSFNESYKEIIEYKFGNHLKCEHRPSLKELEKCEYRDKGYCGRCEHCDPREHYFLELVKLGILDRRGNVTDAYKDIVKVVENS